MNAPVAATLSELEEVNRSLDLLLDHIVGLDFGPRRSLPPRPGLQSVADIARQYSWGRQTTAAERFAMDLRYDPVRETLALAVKQLGRRLHEIGGLKAMQDACDRQEDLPRGMYRVDIVDKRFDGIGGWAA